MRVNPQQPAKMPLSIGCYADSIFGMRHVYQSLRDLLYELWGYGVDHALSLVTEFDNEPEDWEFVHEWADDAIELLNNHIDEGLMIAFNNGDLMVWLDETEVSK